MDEYSEDCCWESPGDRRYCNRKGCDCACHTDPPSRPAYETLRSLLFDAASNIHVLEKHGPYGSSFLDCERESCTQRREASAPNYRTPGEPS